MLLPVGAGSALQDVREPLFRALRADRSDDGDDDDDDGGEGDGYRYERLRDSVFLLLFVTNTREETSDCLVSAAGSDLLLQINVFLCTLTFEIPLCLLFYFLYF